MAIHRTGISYWNSHDNTSVDWLLANVGDEILIVHELDVKEYAISSTDNQWIFNNTDGYLAIGSTVWVTGGDFTQFNVGDTITYTEISGGSHYYGIVIVEKLSNTEIRLGTNPAAWAANTVGTTNVISISVPVTALSYKWNFIENNESLNFNSKIDNSIQVASISALNAGGGGLNKPMTMLGSACYQIRNILVDEIGITTTPIYISHFKIKHRTRITPIMLAQQWADIQAGIAPTYFFNQNCLKPAFYYEARYLVSDPNRIQTLQIDEQLGNTGWYNENFNTGVTSYSIQNLFYTHNGIQVPQPKLDSVIPTLFQFDIVNTTSNPFIANATNLVLNFAKAPNDETEYQNNGRDITHNFVWESKPFTVQISPTPVNGDNYSNVYLRSLANLKATFVSSSVIRITGDLAFTSQSKSVFEESEEPRYLFFVAIQNSALTGAASDRVTLKIDFNKFYYQSDFPNLITFTSNLIDHTNNTYDLAAPDRVSKFSEDEIVGFSNVYVHTDPLVTSFLLKKYTAYVKAYNTVTGAEFILEQKTVQLPATPLNTGGFQNFNIALNKDIHVPTAEIRKQIIARSLPPDAFRYELAYPFLVRWEYWEAFLNGIPLFPANNEWDNYNSNNWQLRFTNELTAKVNGIPANYSSSINFKVYKPNLETEEITASIKTYDNTSNVELTDIPGNKFILGYDYTRVKATFTRHTAWKNPTIVIGIEKFEQGGVTGKRRMSSKWDSDSDTWFMPLATMTSNRVKITNVTSIIVTGECLIDFTQLDLGNIKWKLSARIYDTVGANGIVTDGYGYFKTQNVTLIANNPISITPTVITAKQLDCCDDLRWNVLADATTSDPIKNDKNSFLWWFDKSVINAAVTYLVKDGVDYLLMGNSNYGVPHDYTFYTNPSNQNLIGYEIDWNKVINTLGEGMYQIKCVATTIFGATITQLSDTYCLAQYTESRAENTVRVEYYNTGILGDKNDEKIKDFGTLSWYNQHRFDGSFIFKSSEIKEDDIIYSNGQRKYVELDQEPEYTLELKPIPAFKHDVLRMEIIMADSILITDYNSKNFETYYKKKVKNKGGYSPKLYPLKSKLGSVSLTFIQEFNNLKKFRS